jgi:hypothetical protein
MKLLHACAILFYVIIINITINSITNIINIININIIMSQINCSK